MTHFAVITGDLIGSTMVEDPPAYRDRLRELLDLASDRYQVVADMFRGDGFQVTADDHVNAVWLTVLLRVGLIARCTTRNDRWDARIAIAFGPGQLSLADLNTAVHVNSGRTLDGMKNRDNLRIHCSDERMTMATDAATAFADDILNHLTPTEAEVLFYHLLEGESHQQIADRLDKQRPTVTLALQRARYRLLDRYIRDMDKLVRLFHG